MILRNKRFIAVTIIAAIAGLGLFYLYTVNQITCNGPNPYQSNVVEVITAKVTIEPGTPLREEDVLRREVPTQFLPPNPLWARDFEIYVGQEVKTSVEQGQMVLTSDFAEPERKFGVEDLSMDERALKIEGDAINSMAAGIRPEDYIDVMVTLTDEELPRSIALLQRIQVADVEDDESSRSVTLAVTPDEAELLAVIQSEATLNILARDADDEHFHHARSIGLQEALEDVDITNRVRFERDNDSADGKLAMEIPESSIRSLPSEVEAGSRIDVLGVLDPDKLTMEFFEEFVALTVLQDVLVLAADESITVSVTHDEAHLLSMMQVATTFDVLTRNPQHHEIVPIVRQTVKHALQELEVGQRMRQQRQQVERPGCDPHEVYDAAVQGCVPQMDCTGLF